MYHIGYRSYEIDSIEHVDSLRAVRHCDRDPVILADTEYPE